MVEKNWFWLSRKSVSTGMNKVFFKIWISTSRKKSPNKRILLHVDRKMVSTSKNGEFLYEYVSTRQKDCQKYLKISKKIVVKVCL